MTPVIKTAPHVRVATYTRISTDEDHQPYSLEAQAERLGNYVASQDGWELTRTFTDQCSGATLERPFLQRALREAKAGRFDLLLVYRVDRLARSVRGLAQILEELDGANVAFRSATEPFDTTTSAGRMMVQMLGVFAEFERATIVDRVVAGMERKAARGGWLVGAAPFGYGIDSTTGFLIARDDEAAVIPQVFELYGKRRLGSAAIANWLNERGHRTRANKPWSAPAVLTVLRNSAYVGEITFRGECHTSPHPALVDRDLFTTVQSILKQRGEDWSRRASNPSTYLLAGVVVCDRCGCRYVGGAARGRSARYRYYTCWSRLRYGRDHCNADRLSADDLESAVVAALEKTYERDDFIERAIVASHAKANATQPRYGEQLAQVEREITKAEESIERYLHAFEKKTMPEVACGRRIEGLSEELTGLRRRREELAMAMEDMPNELHADADIETARAEVGRLCNGDTPDLPIRKAILQKLVAEVRVESRDSILPTFRVPLRAPVRIVSGMVPPPGIEPRRKV